MYGKEAYNETLDSPISVFMQIDQHRLFSSNAGGRFFFAF